jgi:hypothetical protein
MLPDCQSREQTYILKCSADAQCGNPVWAQFINIFVFINDIAPKRVNNTTNKIKNSRFSCTVWADQACDTSLLYVHREIKNGFQPAIIETDVI